MPSVRENQLEALSIFAFKSLETLAIRGGKHFRFLRITFFALEWL
jgi:hypothetical protein